MSEAEDNLDAAESTDGPTSAEDRFFGVKTQIAKTTTERKAAEESEPTFEVADDSSPVEDKVADSGAADDELDGYSKKVRKRIDKATHKRREAERLAEEAVRAAQQINQHNQQLAAKNKEYESLISQGETALVSQIKQKAQLAAEKANAEYRRAYEEGNTDNIVASQEQMIRAQADLKEAEQYENRLPPAPTNAESQAAYQQQQQQAAYQQQQQQAAYQQQQQQQQQAMPAAPKPDPKAAAWGEKNTWFGNDAHKGMTAYAYALHEEAISDNGLSPNSDQYFEYIDTGMRGRFDDYAWSENASTDASGDGQTATSTTRQASPVVAPSARNNGAKPRKLKLQPSQVALAKRLGLTNTQYANQVIKEMTNG